MTQLPIQPVASVGALAERNALTAVPAGPPANSFARVLLNGLDQVNRKVTDADLAVRAFAVDDSVPLHQVTYALEQARLSVELMSQVRSRLVEGCQELFRMQL